MPPGHGHQYPDSCRPTTIQAGSTEVDRPSRWPAPASGAARTCPTCPHLPALLDRCPRLTRPAGPATVRIQVAGLAPPAQCPPPARRLPSSSRRLMKTANRRRSRAPLSPVARQHDWLPPSEMTCSWRSGRAAPRQQSESADPVRPRASGRQDDAPPQLRHRPGPAACAAGSRCWR